MIFETFDILSARTRPVYDVSYPAHEVLVWRWGGAWEHPTHLELVRDALSVSLATMGLRDAVVAYATTLVHLRHRCGARDVRVYTCLQVEGNVEIPNGSRITLGSFACFHPGFIEGLRYEGGNRPPWFCLQVPVVETIEVSKPRPTSWDHLLTGTQESDA